MRRREINPGLTAEKHRHRDTGDTYILIQGHREDRECVSRCPCMWQRSQDLLVEQLEFFNIALACNAVGIQYSQNPADEINSLLLIKLQYVVLRIQ